MPRVEVAVDYADHPRACGANRTGSIFARRYDGSSPRMRGKHRTDETSAIGNRIIPAHAGQTRRYRRNAARSPDHPRACGANSAVGNSVNRTDGSSPRMRGKPTSDRIALPTCRIIPAHAGQTTRNGTRRRIPPDHPRACGANALRPCRLHARYGSSPRMRGKLDDLRDMLSRLRIIPAHAGQTPPDYASYTVGPDHPRACGANRYAPKYEALIRGSSPRMRGKLTYGYNEFTSQRIIPAHAGQTSRMVRLSDWMSDHPRACGANRSVPFQVFRFVGSSPRMRGKQG